MNEERNTHIVIQDILTQTKIFSGDIFGGIIRDYKIKGTKKINDIDIRLDPTYLHPFLTLLNVKYQINPIHPNKTYNGITIYTYEISHKTNHPPFEKLVLDIVLMGYKLFRMSFIDFDVNLLTENSRSLYVRAVPSCLKFKPDMLSYVRDRITCNKFSYIPLAASRTLPDLAVITEKAISMTERGWVMDDEVPTSATWVVGKWEGMMTGANRRKLPRDRVNQIVERNECTLCHEKFHPHDIVFNTACNHNFHWKCPCSTTNGLRTWVMLNEQNQCPLCRSDIFGC